MLHVTFLGHQGWLIATDTTRVLVDPLLTEGFGHGGLLGRTFPPRRIDLAAFPPIDAVVITHEHDDHFDIPSLHRLDRRIRVFLSERSSIAAHAILSEMGFDVQPIAADQTTAIGDLHWHAFTADHREGDADEWDVLPFLVHDTAGHGSFMSSVDVRPTERMLGALRAIAPPGVWAYANNLTAATLQQIGAPSGGGMQDDAAALVRVVARRHDAVEQSWGAPLLTFVCGAGWSFPGERRFMDHHVFPIDPHELSARVGEIRPQARIAAAVPGQGVQLQHGRIVGRIADAPYLRAAPRSSWPERHHAGDTVRLGAYGPACGRSALVEGELDELLERLSDFARFLYGRPIYRALASLAHEDRKGRRAELGFALKTGDRAQIVGLRHEASACRFVPLPGVDPIADLSCGIECWATDLLALLRGEIGPTALCYAGRLRVWNAVPERARVSPHELWMFAHPLRRPDASLKLYRRLLANEPAIEVRVPAARSASEPAER